MSFREELEAERVVARRYEDLGYSVVTEPLASEIPFPLGGYRPDILAQRGDEHLLIEVKRSGSKVDSAYFLKLAEEIHRHAGWRFLVVTIPDEELHRDEVSSANLTIASLRQHLRRIDELTAGTPPGMVLPQLWVACISAIRLLLDRDGVSAEGLTDLSLLNRAYSEGVISFDEYEASRRFQRLRNEAVHSLNPSLDDGSSQALRAMIEVLIGRLEGATSH